jgi:hypothetical protein
MRYVAASRAIVWVLLIVAVLGPWAYTADGAPPAAWCDEPHVLLENGRCVGPVSGAAMLWTMAAGAIQMGVGLLTGATVLAGRMREFLWVSGFVALSCALVSPLVTTLLLAWRKEDRVVRGCHLAAWIWAAGLSLLWLLLAIPAELRAALWGTGLHFTLSVVTLVLELVMLLTDRKPA